MKKDSVKGWKDVFTFTLTQTLKSKAYRVTLVIMLLFAMVSMPIMNLVLGGDIAAGPEKSVIEKVYFYNMTLYRNLDVDSELTDAYKHIVFESAVGDVKAQETIRLAGFHYQKPVNHSPLNCITVSPDKHISESTLGVVILSFPEIAFNQFFIF